MTFELPSRTVVLGAPGRAQCAKLGGTPEKRGSEWLPGALGGQGHGSAHVLGSEHRPLLRPGSPRGF